jgi:branched-chain amino acid transport system substrate-binding protein
VKRILLLAAALAAAAAIPGAQAGPAKDPGVTSTTILLGGTAPLSGPEVAYAAVARGADAYFKYVNSRGGVKGRTITYRYLDDGYDAAQTVQKTRELVQQQGVFAIFNSVGTEQSLAVRPFLNQLRVPQLFVGSGASAIGGAYRRFPWTMGYLTSFRGEGAIYGRHVAKTMPSARIAVLHENSDYGKDMVAGLRKGLGAKAGRIAAVETYEVTDADLNAQIARLKASGANTFMLFALPKQTIQAFIAADRLGWRPRVFVNAVSVDPFVMNVARLNTNNRTTQGAITTAFLKDPTDPGTAKDPGVKLYKRLMARYLPGKEKEVAHIYGMAAAYTMVDALRKAGKQLTRAGLLKAATRLDERENPFLVKGVVVKTGPTDYYPISTTRLLRYDKGRWRQFGGVLAVR